MAAREDVAVYPRQAMVRLLATACVIMAILLLLAAPRPAAGAVVTNLEAEKMSLPAKKGKIFRDARASARQARSIRSPADAVKQIATPAVERISVRARGEQCKGAPLMVVLVDGKRVAAQRVSSERWTYYEAPIALRKGEHKVQVGFRDDRRVPRKCDRTLKVDVIRFEANEAPESGRDTGSIAAPKPTCSTSLQSLVDAASPGAIVVAPGGCVYREAITIDKPLTLRAGPGAEIRGSDVWTDWTRSESYWVKGGLPEFPTGGQCKPGTSRCLWPEQVFVDGEPLLQVASNPESGQFAVDGDRRVILADDPTGRTVEVTTRRSWISGRSAGVTIEGFTMKHAANESQSGALRNNGYDNWTVRNNDLSYAHGSNVGLGSATGLLIVGNDIHHGGQFGINGSYASLEVRDNEIHHNNTEAFDTTWAAGGMKNTRMNRLVVDGNEIYENDRVGIWTDIGSKNVTYSNNRIYRNTQIGIHLEISDNARIFGNSIWENGWGKPDSGFGEAGILVSSSRNVEVYRNVLAWNNDGISVVNQDRTQGDGTEFDKVTGVRVYDNDILTRDYDGGQHMALAWIKAYAGGNIYEPAADNRGYDNRYWYPDTEGSAYRYKWSSSSKELSAFNGTPGEERGRYLSSTEKDRLVAGSGVPANSRY